MTTRWARRLAALFCLALPLSASAQSNYLFAWAGDGDRKSSDFLAVLDANPASPDYGHTVATLSLGATGLMPHHTEYEFPASGMLLANGWAASKTYLLDLRNPKSPTVAATFRQVGGYSFPHSFARLANGHVLATFQGSGEAYAPPGALVELDERGKFIRSSSAASAELRDSLAWPYSLVVDAGHDRVLTTVTTMPIPAWLKAPAGSWRKSRVDSITTTQIQVWSLSSLKLLSTISLPAPANGKTLKIKPNEFPAEPRLLPDGSIYVNTFNCGLYHVTGIEKPAPKITAVATFPVADGKSCAVPAVVGHYWIQTVAALPGLVALDISKPDNPVEVSRLILDAQHAMPHWLASDAKGSRVVLTGDDMGFVMIVNVDPKTGALSIDKRFKDERTGAAGVSLDGRNYPQGAIKRVFVHGTLFGQ